MVVEKVMVSAPEPPIRVSTLEIEPELAKAPRVSLSLPEPRSMLLAVVSAAPSVMVSLPEPPVRLSTLETVAVLAKSPSVSVSSPAPRLMEALETWVA